MSSRNYQRFPIEEFGRYLLISGDLDPVYIALRRVEWPEEQIKRWLVAYWCCYHPGACSYISEAEGKSFWATLLTAAANMERSPPPVGDRWPRAPERRHWRGHAAVQCVERLRDRYPSGPEAMVDYIAVGDTSFSAVTRRAEEHPLFGPWISFKVADMLERVLDVPVEFTLDNVMYDSPVKAALQQARHHMKLPDEAVFKNERQVVSNVVAELLKVFGTIEAPPWTGRPVNLQEIETILCKWGSHLSGHYPINNDLIEIRQGLVPWAEVSPAAREFLHWFPMVNQSMGERLAAATG